MWTRFFPAVLKARELIAAGEIGEVKAVHSDFGFVLDPEARPHMVDPAQGGGGLMEIGCYPIAAAVMALGSEPGVNVAAGGVVRGGVDLDAGVVLTRPDGRIATLSYSLQAQTPEETLYVGDKGYIRVHSPAHCLSLIHISEPTRPY
eukprot:TRINITY_DN41450_c0_g1_i1.p1 TRINITY_DN41450_c0_g1~~TRINITY_DN41450_c0_g1_i1.p1  ORF type:complete len:147 (-),score=29.16 TRINITY_DN41450_c0_g1_i1:48-488(-)